MTNAQRQAQAAKFREGYTQAIQAVYANLNELADGIADQDDHGAAILRYVAEVIWHYEPGE